MTKPSGYPAIINKRNGQYWEARRGTSAVGTAGVRVRSLVPTKGHPIQPTDWGFKKTKGHDKTVKSHWVVFLCKLSLAV